MSVERQRACFTCGHEESTDGTEATCRRCLRAKVAAQARKAVPVDEWEESRKRLITTIDNLTQMYFVARQGVIAEFSGDIAHDHAALLAEVNQMRDGVGLAPIERPDHWPDPADLTTL